jgi:hypothetical protein
MDADSPAARLRLALELSDVAERMRAQRFRRENPRLGDEAIDALMQSWRGARSGAEAGDAPGRSVPWPRPR